MGSDLRAQAEQLARVELSTGRFYLNVCGVAVAMEADWCRDPQFPGNIWSKATLDEAARIINDQIESALRGVRDAERQRVKALVKAAEALSKKWGDEAHEIDQDGDFCCAQTRRNDAGELHDLLRKYAASSPRPSGEER